VLEGRIPNEFGKVMSSLRVLDLSDNKLQGAIPFLWEHMHIAVFTAPK